LKRHLSKVCLFNIIKNELIFLDQELFKGESNLKMNNFVYRNKLFTKFIDCENNGNGVANGMGLGLYLIKKIIQKQAGLAFPTDSLLPIKPAQPRLAAIR
jgi:hypothetical protein